MTEKIETKKKSKRINSKSKGSGFESTIAKMFSKAFEPLNFIRSPGSGARLGGKNFETFGKMFGADATKLFVGDVVCLNERDTGIEFLHSVECKSYKTPDSFPSLLNGKANIYKWFEESKIDAEKTNKNPILIFKWNNTPIFIAINDECVLPSNINKIVLTNGIQICLLDDLILHLDFWIKK